MLLHDRYNTINYTIVEGVHLTGSAIIIAIRKQQDGAHLGLISATDRSNTVRLFLRKSSWQSIFCSDYTIIAYIINAAVMVSIEKCIELKTHCTRNRELPYFD